MKKLSVLFAALAFMPYSAAAIEHLPPPLTLFKRLFFSNRRFHEARRRNGRNVKTL